MGFLSRDDILKADDRKTEVVPVPEWGGDVRLRTLSGAERDAFEASTVEVRGGKQRQNFKNLRARLVALCLVDEDNRRMFTSGDVAKLGEKSSAALDRLFTKCQEMNGLSDGDVEELTEGFDSDPDEDSDSD